MDQAKTLREWGSRRPQLRFGMVDFGELSLHARQNLRASFEEELRLEGIYATCVEGLPVEPLAEEARLFVVVRAGARQIARAAERLREWEREALVPARVYFYVVDVKRERERSLVIKNLTTILGRFGFAESAQRFQVLFAENFAAPFRSRGFLLDWLTGSRGAIRSEKSFASEIVKQLRVFEFFEEPGLLRVLRDKERIQDEPVGSQTDLTSPWSQAPATDEERA